MLLNIQISYLRKYAFFLGSRNGARSKYKTIFGVTLWNRVKKVKDISSKSGPLHSVARLICSHYFVSGLIGVSYLCAALIGASYFGGSHLVQMMTAVLPQVYFGANYLLLYSMIERDACRLGFFWTLLIYK